MLSSVSFLVPAAANICADQANPILFFNSTNITFYLLSVLFVLKQEAHLAILLDFCPSSLNIVYVEVLKAIKVAKCGRRI